MLVSPVVIERAARRERGELVLESRAATRLLRSVRAYGRRPGAVARFERPETIAVPAPNEK